jgi:hypothetical protein
MAAAILSSAVSTAIIPRHPRPKRNGQSGRVGTAKAESALSADLPDDAEGVVESQIGRGPVSEWLLGQPTKPREAGSSKIPVEMPDSKERVPTTDSSWATVVSRRGR